MRVAFHTLGCKLNSTETAAIQRQFLADGHDVVEYGAEADLLVVNTCTVTEQADVECRKVVRRGLRGAPNARVIVTGCYAQLQPEEVASIDGVTAVVGTADKLRMVERLPELLESDTVTFLVEELSSLTTFIGARSGNGNSRTRAFLKIQDGCDYSCSFCTIPLARGPARAMPLESIKRELQAIAIDGYEECILTGINLGEYVSAEGKRFVDVLSMIADMELSYRVRIGSIEPNTLHDDVLRVWKDNGIFVPHLHMPLQSGSDAVLRSMKRRYNTAMYQQRVTSFHSAFPDGAVGIDVIAGYPGESDAQFQETVNFLHSIPWTYLHVFTYSERENTLASSLPTSVPMQVRRERTRLLRALSEARTRDFHASQLGSKRTFLPEGYDPATGSWSGWTENHVAGILRAPYTISKKRMAVRLEGLIDDRVVVVPIEGES
jgi:threonylcarbamoyladenosine tRNA methylthiotransferase MtaB